MWGVSQVSPIEMICMKFVLISYDLFDRFVRKCSNQIIHEYSYMEESHLFWCISQGDPKLQGLTVTLGWVSHAWAVSAQGWPMREISEAGQNRAG